MKKDIAKIEQKPTPRDTQHQNIGHRKDPTTQITRKEPNPAQDPIHTTRTTETTTPATMTTRKDPTTQNTKKDPNPAQDKTHTTRTTDATTAATTTTRKQGTETEATTSQDNETGIATRNTHHPDTRATTDRTKTIGGEETQHPTTIKKRQNITGNVKQHTANTSYNKCRLRFLHKGQQKRPIRKINDRLHHDVSTNHKKHQQHNNWWGRCA